MKIHLSSLLIILGLLCTTLCGFATVNVPVPPKAIIKGYAPGSFGQEIQYKSPEEGKYSKEYLPIIPPADTNRKPPLPKGEKAIVLNRDTSEMDSQDFTKLKFQGAPAPFPIGTVLKVIKPENLNLYKEDQSIVPDSELTYIVIPPIPGFFDPSSLWLHKLATTGESVAWARGTAGWHIQKGGDITLNITLPDGKNDSATLKLVPRRHVVIIVGGSSMNKDNAHALEFKNDKFFLPDNLKNANDPLKDFDGKEISTLKYKEWVKLKSAIMKFRTVNKYKAHDNSPANFSNKGMVNGKKLVDEECEVHIIANASAIARRAQKNNVFRGFSYVSPAGKSPRRRARFYKANSTWDVIGSLKGVSTNYRTAKGKGKSNPLVGTDDLSQAVKDLAKKIKIDDLVYFGHSASGRLFYEYGSKPSNDAHQDVGGRRSGAAKASPEGIFYPTHFFQSDFIEKNKPTFYHHGCNGWTLRNSVPGSSFCGQVKTRLKLVTAVGVPDGKTNYVNDRTMLFNIVCDGKKTSITVPKPTAPAVYQDEPN